MTEAGFPDLLKVARVLKSNGTDGDLLVGFRGILPEDLETQEPVFIYFDGLPVPFFIEKFENRGSSRAIMHLTGVGNLTDAEEMVSRDIYTDASLVAGPDESEPDLTGWKAIGTSGETLGEITGFEDIPGNPCIYLRRPDGSEILAPLHEDFIVSLDPDTRIITLELPAGLC